MNIYTCYVLIKCRIENKGNGELVEFLFWGFNMIVISYYKVFFYFFWVFGELVN